MKIVFYVKIYRTDGAVLPLCFYNAHDVFIAATIASSLGCTTTCTVQRVPDSVKSFDWDVYDNDVPLDNFLVPDDDLQW